VQRLVHVALRGAQPGLGLRAGPQANHGGRGALRRQLAGHPGRRERQPRRGAEILQPAGCVPVRQGGKAGEAEKDAHRQQDKQHQLGAHLQPRKRRGARALVPLPSQAAPPPATPIIESQIITGHLAGRFL
jgi:hypothetical protein